MKKIFAAAVIGMIAFAAAGQKIATVNMDRLFNDYYKTPQIEALLKQQQQVFQTYLNGQIEKLRSMEKKFQIELDKSQNVSLAEKVRASAASECEKLSSEIKLLQTSMQRYANDKRNEMTKISRDKRLDLIQEISETVRKTAVNQGYDFVLDISGRSLNDVPGVVYASSAFDLTVEVLNILNKGNMPAKVKK